MLTQSIKLDGRSLQCPHCQDANLHQIMVQIVTRGSMSNGKGRTTLIEGAATTVRDIDAIDAPGDRQSTSIKFSCENCDNQSLLDIVQHKGQTLVRWSSGL